MEVYQKDFKKYEAYNFSKPYNNYTKGKIVIDETDLIPEDKQFFIRYNLAVAFRVRLSTATGIYRHVEDVGAESGT